MKYQDFINLPTPSYVFSADELTERLKTIRTALGPEIRLVYAMKANPFLILPALPHVDALEVCSPGEAEICAASDISPAKLVLSGVNKEPDNFRMLADRWGDAPVYTAESKAQLELLNTIALERNLVFRVLLRVTAGNQFGMDEPDLFDLIRHRDSFHGIDMCGLQYYSGTQKLPRQIKSEIEYLDDLITRLGLETGFTTQELEYGPGLSVQYFINETDCDPVETIGNLKELLNNMQFTGQITLEMGRFLTAYCGYYATRIADCKQISGRTCCITDGGVHQLNYFGQSMAMKVPHILTKAADSSGQTVSADARTCDQTSSLPSCTIYGSLCTTADVLVREITLPAPEPGDLLVFTRTGAYSVTEGISLFLSRDLPAVYLSTKGTMNKVRQQQPTWRFNNGTITGNT